MSPETIDLAKNGPGTIPKPKESLEFSMEKADAWIEKENDPDIKIIKRKIVENIQHISFTEFQDRAEDVVTRALQVLANLDEKYAVFFDYKPHSSKRWMYELTANCYTANPPTETGFFTPSWEKMSGNKKLRQIVESGVNTFLISDDAAYSGEQIVNRQIDPIIKFYETEGIQAKPKFVLAIPFVTSHFLRLIDKLREETGCEFEVFSNSQMPSLDEILTADEKRILQVKREGKLEADDYEQTYLGATVTYFDHRVADDHSFSGEVRSALDISAVKPYADEDTSYFKKESADFEEYKNTVYPNQS